ncbi:DNA mismatch repair endonuclease MutL [Gorillibacterium timonense]|uniref:DNA mismatch repair endonuclease MutL n=1 Tax=Gorillibacterium timonense TaxID=1689269 RepID=UPI00071E4929|nr:DNA mismatch repair endonuclease MutL [Gorillibacterium timonense]
MGIIRLLDDHIANQIAAGEVVERPSSVVKELVENSVDAGSTRVDVTIEEGGLQLIRVKDNGTGIADDDCEIAFARHATSKIRSGKELFQIRTLGFRGEALPSIAAVAKVECITTGRTDGLGRRIAIEGGTLVSVEETAAERGTDIRVRELFYNTPARLKYMKTIQTELGHVSDYLYRIAMAHPEIAFTLRHNGHTLLNTLGNGDLLGVLAAVYGASTAKSMVEVQAEDLDYVVHGFVSRPETTRTGRAALTLVVNGRYIRSYAVTQAILRAYHTLLPVNRYPVGALHLTMDPSLLDVNVHPSKLEVRFSKEVELVSLIEAAVRAALGRQTLIPAGGKTAIGKNAVVQEQFALYRPSEDSGPVPANAPLPEPPELTAASGGSGTGVASTASEFSGSGERRFGEASGVSVSPTASFGKMSTGASFTDGTTSRPSWPEERSADSRSFSPESSSDAQRSSFAGSDRSDRSEQGRSPMPGSSAAYADRSIAGTPSATRASSGSFGVFPGRPASAGLSAPITAEQLARIVAPSDGSAPAMPAFPKLDPVGQLHGTYLVAQNEEGMYLIDQHAAHERINYEYYREKFGKPEEASQELLLPLTLDFTSAEAAVLETRLSLLEQAGLYLEPFGGTSFLVRAYPHWLPVGEEKDLVEEMIDWVLAEKKAVDLSAFRDAAAAMCSCKASIKANQPITHSEMEALLDRLSACRNPYTCPHGRPILVSFTLYELEKMFKRVM